MEDIYAKPDLTKKVRFQKNEGANKEESDKNVKDEVGSVMIYDNYWAEGNSSPTVEDNTTKDQQQTQPVDVNSDKRKYVQTALLLMGLLFFLLLVTVIVLVVLSISSWSSERNMRITLQKSNGDLESFNHNLTKRNRLLEDEKTNLTKRNRLLEDEKTNLTIERDQLGAINTNLTSEKKLLKTINSKLTSEGDQLKAINTDLTEERDELRKKLLEADSCPDGWIRFEWHCYLIPTSKKTWHDGKKDCENRGATLGVVSNEEEQRFMSSLKQIFWIGLNDIQKEKDWKWVNGEELTKTYWKTGQPDNCCRGEDCVMLKIQSNPLKTWNDQHCGAKLLFICEKALK